MVTVAITVMVIVMVAITVMVTVTVAIRAMVNVIVILFALPLDFPFGMQQPSSLKVTVVSRYHRLHVLTSSWLLPLPLTTLNVSTVADIMLSISQNNYCRPGYLIYTHREKNSQNSGGPGSWLHPGWSTCGRHCGRSCSGCSGNWGTAEN